MPDKHHHSAGGLPVASRIAASLEKIFEAHEAHEMLTYKVY